jgi:hypothetical protein
VALNGITFISRLIKLGQIVQLLKGGHADCIVVIFSLKNLMIGNRKDVFFFTWPSQGMHEFTPQWLSWFSYIIYIYLHLSYNFCVFSPN